MMEQLAHRLLAPRAPRPTRNAPGLERHLIIHPQSTEERLKLHQAMGVSGLSDVIACTLAASMIRRKQTL